MLSPRSTNIPYAVVGIGAVSALGWLIRWAIDAPTTATVMDIPRLLFTVNATCLVVAGLSFSLADQWPVRVGGLSLLLGLGLTFGLPSYFWLGMMFVSICLMLVLATVRKMDRV